MFYTLLILTKFVRYDFLKITFILGLPNPFPGAGWIRINHIANLCFNFGHLIDVLGVFTIRSIEKRGKSIFSNMRLFNFPLRIENRKPFFFFFNSISFFICSFFYLLCRRPNIVVISVPSGDVGLAAILVCRLLKINYVVDYRDEWEDLALSLANTKVEKNFYVTIRYLARYFYSKCCLLVTVTSNCKTALEKRGLYNIKIIPNGADLSCFNQSQNKKHGFTLFYSGGVGGYYNLVVVLKAIKWCKEFGISDINLNIAGTGAIPHILNVASILCVSNNVDYKGALSQKADLSKLIAEADVGIIPFDANPLWKNALPAKFFEYCACGLPVIATVYQDSLLGELINNHKIGFISPPLDDFKLAQTIYILYHDKPYRVAAGQRARVLIEEKFNRNKSALEFLKLIKEKQKCH